MALAAKKKAGGQFTDEDKLYFQSTKDTMKQLKDSIPIDTIGTA